jgi:hypothetical protein
MFEDADESFEVFLLGDQEGGRICFGFLPEDQATMVL